MTIVRKAERVTLNPVRPIAGTSTPTGKQGVMASRIRNRHELRKQAEQAEQMEAAVSEPAVAAAAPGLAGRRKAAAKPKVARARRSKPCRACVPAGASLTAP